MAPAREHGTLHGDAADEAAVLVRNHDLSTGHRVAVRAYGPGGDVAYEAAFDLGPGAAVTDDAALPAGSHTVEADCDAERYLVRTCRVGPDEGLLVAVGNGVVDVAPRPAP